MRILILGGSAINKGAEAMLQTVRAELGDRIPGASFFIGDRRARQWHPEGVEALGFPHAPAQEPQGALRLARAVLHGVRAPEGPVHWLRHRRQLGYFEALADAVDAAVDVSGFLFSDQRGTTGKRLVPLIEVFRRRGTPFVLLPQAWGPFEKPAVRDLAERAVGAADLAFARDDISYKHLSALVDGRVELAPDIAFLFRAAPDGPERMRELGLDPERPIAAIAPNMRVYERTGGEGEANLYGRALARVGRSLLAEGAQVLLVPHEILPPSDGGHDDRYLCRLVADALDAPGVAAVTDDRPAGDLKALIGVCELMVGSRFHALVAALSSGVPSVAVGWAHKYPELLREFGLEGSVFDHNTLTAEALEAAVLDMWRRRGLVRESIAATLPDVKGRAATVFDRTRDALQARKTRSSR